MTQSTTTQLPTQATTKLVRSIIAQELIDSFFVRARYDIRNVFTRGNFFKKNIGPKPCELPRFVLLLTRQI